jgi:hypothetical protein
MLKVLISIFFIQFILIGNLLAQSFPAGAVILEQQTVTTNRQLILWMQNPTQNPRSDDEDDIYTCPDETRGSYYSGKVKVSLVDLKKKKIINTLEIFGNGITSNDNTLDLPYWIHRGYYEVPLIDEKKEGKPLLMNLKDYNNDSKPYEFALFDAVACMGLPSTLIGYSQKQDKVIQYQTELKTSDGTAKRFWVDYFFGQKADKKGIWKYEIDYRGRGGDLEKYEIRYDKEKETFYGTRTSVREEN